MKRQFPLLIITDPVDPHAESVMDSLEARGIFSFRFHPADLLRDFSLSCIDVQESGQETFFKTPSGLTVSSKEVKSIYCRNTDKVRLPRSINDEGVAFYAANESEHNFKDLIEAIPGYWLTRPSLIKHAQSKVVQAKTAREVGLKVPKSCWSNDRDKILEFLEQCGGEIVGKPVSDVHYYLNGKPHTVWVTKITREFLEANKADLPLMFAFYQEHVDRELDIRVTVVGDRIYSCGIIIPPDNNHVTDWRTINVPLKYQPIKLPNNIEEKLFNFNQVLGVDFGAMDLLRAKNGEYYFLESNINGQWLWIQQLAGLPISDSIADLLITKGGIK
jgi:glutathione synthase/RimK-type ligase-like ATP-grasp enzyme